MAWKTVYEVAQAEFSQNEYVEGTRSWSEPYSSLYRRMVVDIKGADKIRITLGNTAPVVLPQHEEAKIVYGEGTYENYAFTPSFANYPVAVHLNGMVYIPLGDGTSVAYDIKIEVEEQGSVHIKETVDANEYIEWQKVYNGSIPVEKGFMMPDEADITIDGGEKYHVTKNQSGDYGELDPNTHATSFENYPFYISYYVDDLLLKINFQNEGSYLVEISAGSDDPTPSKKPAPIGVKEAMKHFISVVHVEVEPKNTIKGLTKQIFDPRNEYPTIQNARTIADIYEQIAILSGFVPEEGNKTIGVKEAMKHFILTEFPEITPANTIKGLLKQYLDPLGEVEAIQKARTIADIWEQSAIARGYEPDEGGDGGAIVGKAVVGKSKI